jgi:hypothetical protein
MMNTLLNEESVASNTTIKAPPTKLMIKSSMQHNAKMTANNHNSNNQISETPYANQTLIEKKNKKNLNNLSQNLMNTSSKSQLRIPREKITIS